MTDYYPLVARAVAGLSTNTGELRRALYERARTALVSQLRNSEPPLSEDDITRERLALEEAIRKVEASAAHRPNDLLAELEAEAEQARADAAARAAEPAAEPPPESSNHEYPASRPPERTTENFRDTLGEAEQLGSASSQSVRDARDTYDAMPDGDRPARPREKVIGGGAPPPFDDGHVDRGPVRSYAALLKILLILIALAAIASAGWWQRNNIMSLLTPSRQPTQTVRNDANSTARPKIADRVTPGSGEQSGTAPASDVAQKVVLYEEDSNDPQGKRYVGSVLWRTETVSPGPGLAPELAIRGDVDIPERRMRMSWSLRRNADRALPASHTIEIMFTTPADFSEGGIANVPGVLMKSAEQTRGTPLSGLAVKVTAGYFLIGLSSADTDMQRNLQLLKERPWFDVPVVYNNGKRAIIAVEKGPGGERIFEDALRAWGQ
jgi:hypothetical protein